MKSFPTLIPVVAVALIRPDGKMLLQKRPMQKAHGGLWEFPGGKVEAGESCESALIREIREELDVEIDATALDSFAFAADSDRIEGAPSGIVILLYICRSWSGEPRNLDAEEIGWFGAAELASLAMPPLDVPLAARIAEAFT